MKRLVEDCSSICSHRYGACDGMTSAAFGCRRTCVLPARRPHAPAAAPRPHRDADKQWTMPNKNYASTRYSALNEINTDNVKNLKVAWTFSTGVLRGHEGEPLVVGNTMYVAHAVPEHRLRPRSEQGRRADQVEVRAEAGRAASFPSRAATR